MDFSISHFWSTHLVGGCSFYMSNITCLSYFFKKKIFSITIPCSWKNHGNIHLTHFNHIQETLYLSAFQDFLLIKTFHRRDFLSLYFKMTYFPLLSHFSASYNQSNNTFKLIKAPEFVVPLSYGTQFVVLSVSPSRTLS